MKNIAKVSVVGVALYSMSVMANYVSVTTQDGSADVWQADVETTSQYKSRNGLVTEIDQARLYITQADGTQYVSSINVSTLNDVVFPDVQLPATDEVQHSLVLQLLGEEQGGYRQITFSSVRVPFDINPNQITTVNGLNLYLTRKDVVSVFTDSYLTPGETYQLETTSGNLRTVTMDADSTTFLQTYDAGERPKTLYDADGDKLGDVTDDVTFGSVRTESVNITINDGSVVVNAQLMSADSLYSTPGLLVDDLPSEEKRYYDISLSAAAGSYAIVVTVGGALVSYPATVNGVPTNVGPVESHIFDSDGDVINVQIDFGEYDFITKPEVRIYLQTGGAI